MREDAARFLREGYTRRRRARRASVQPGAGDGGEEGVRECGLGGGVPEATVPAVGGMPAEQLLEEWKHVDCVTCSEQGEADKRVEERQECDGEMGGHSEASGEGGK